MTVAGTTAQPLQPAAPFARWSAVLAAGLGCLALAVVVATFPLGSMAGQLNPQIVGSTVVALAFAVVGLLVALRQPRNAMGWLLLAGSLLIALNFAASCYTELDYGAVTVLLAGAYAGLVLLATRELRFSSEVAVAVSTLAAAAAFNPVRRRVQHAVDRRFNRARYDADRIVAAFAARLQDMADPDATTLDLGETVQQALEPEHLSLWIGEVVS
jgi:hypothetical protein